MIGNVIIALFILSLAITAGGILLSSHLRSTYKADFLSSLLFFQVFWYTFGFYALWGQILLVSFIRPLVEPGLFSKISSLSLFLGSPFLLFAWLMLVKLAREMTGRGTGNAFIAIFLTTNILIIPGLGHLLSRFGHLDIMAIIRYLYLFICFVLTGLAVWTLLRCRKNMNRIEIRDIKAMGLIMFFMLLLQCSLLLLSEISDYFSLAFILLYFLFGGFLPVYLRYLTDMSTLLMPGETSLNFEQFCRRYEISKREKEVIHEICRGLSNQEIADRLFISLQTVKDHTHRIYGKTNCSSRAQLMRMVGEGDRVG